jgi:hypothetical protein
MTAVNRPGPEAPKVYASCEMAAFLLAAKDGEFDDLVDRRTSRPYWRHSPPVLSSARERPSDSELSDASKGLHAPCPHTPVQVIGPGVFVWQLSACHTAVPGVPARFVSRWCARCCSNNDQRSFIATPTASIGQLPSS